MRAGKAVFSRKPFAVVSYSQIARIHLDPICGESDVPLFYYLYIYSKDGKRFKIENVTEIWYEQIQKDVPGVICDPEPK